MTLKTIEGWDGLSDPRERYVTVSSSYSTIDTVVPRTGRACIRQGGSTTDYIVIPTHSETNEIYIGFAFRMSGTPSLSDYVFLGFYAEGTGCGLTIQSDGSINWRTGLTNVGNSGVNVLAIDTWYYIEVKVVKSNSINEDDCIVKVNGVEWINLPPGTDTAYASYPLITKSVLFYGYSGHYRYCDDIYICDGNGPAPCNTFLGDCKVATIHPNDNGNVNNFTGSDANSTDNYLHVDDGVGHDSDSSYVESATVGHIDLYGFAVMPEASEIIYGVEAVSSIRIDQPGASKIASHITRVNGTNYVHADLMGSDINYASYGSIWELNPDDSAAWEDADIAAAEFGVKIIA